MCFNKTEQKIRVSPYFYLVTNHLWGVVIIVSTMWINKIKGGLLNKMVDCLLYITVIPAGVASPSCALHLQQSSLPLKPKYRTQLTQFVAIRKLTAAIFKPEKNKTSLGMLSLAYKVWRSFLTRFDRSCFTHGPRYLSAGRLEFGVEPGVADSKDCLSSNRLVTLLTPEVYHKVLQDLMDSWLRLIDGSLSSLGVRPWTTYPAVKTSRSR